MRRHFLTLALSLLSILPLLVCGCRGDANLERDEWASVLARKQAYRNASPADAPARRQEWVDAVREFVIRHPEHERAAVVFEEIQIEFARGLSDRGRLRAAEQYYVNILARNPDHAVAADELATIRERLGLSTELFARVQTSMTPDEVVEILGPPPPGWTRSIDRNGHVTESWYYQRADGNLATVYFAGGLVLATDYGPSEP